MVPSVLPWENGLRICSPGKSIIPPLHLFPLVTKSLFLTSVSLFCKFCFRLHIWDFIWYLSFSVWLISLSMINCRSLGSTRSKEPACQCRRRNILEFDSWLGRSPEGKHSNLLKYSCLENPMDRGAWQATVHQVAKSQTWLQWLSTRADPWD